MRERIDKKTVIITGTSAGIGRAAALAFAEAGYTTYATARRLDSIKDLQEKGLFILPLDVTDEKSMTDAVTTIESKHGAVDILVNDAGYSQMGPIEEVSLELVRKQFETNVFGLIRLSQLVLPGMRQKHSGRIINISSMGGEFTTPLAGIYHASKYAVESISDAMRFEVSPFGIQVVIIQPGVVKTRASATVSKDLDIREDSPYYDQLTGFKNFLEKNSSEDDPSAVSAEVIAKVILEAAESPQPETRYKVGEEAKQISNIRRELSDIEWDDLFREQFGL